MEGTAQQVKDRLDNPAQRLFARAAYKRGGGDGFNTAHSASVKSFGKANPVRASGIGPHHRTLKVCYKTPESTVRRSVKLTR